LRPKASNNSSSALAFRAGLRLFLEPMH
jgi:hypothetical protein